MKLHTPYGLIIVEDAISFNVTVTSYPHLSNLSPVLLQATLNSAIQRKKGACWKEEGSQEERDERG